MREDTLPLHTRAALVRPPAVAVPSAPFVPSVHNAVRQLTSETNANGQVTIYTYCGCGSPSSITRYNGASALVTQFTYDSEGRLTTALYPDGYQVNRTYDSHDRLQTVTDSGGRHLELDYAQVGLRDLIAHAHLVSDGGGYNLLLLSRTFDEYGRVITSVDRNGVTMTNSYDLLNRLPHASHATARSTARLRSHKTLDSIGSARMHAQNTPSVSPAARIFLFLPNLNLNLNPHHPSSTFHPLSSAAAFATMISRHHRMTPMFKVQGSTVPAVPRFNDSTIQRPHAPTLHAILHLPSSILYPLSTTAPSADPTQRQLTPANTS